MSDNNENLSERKENTWADRNEKPAQWASRSNDSERMEARRRKLSPQVINVLGAHIIAAFLTFVGMNLLGLVMSEGAAMAIGYIAGAFAFVAVLYIEGWRAGEQDMNMMNYGHIKKDKLRGLKAACIAESVGALLAVLMIAHGFVVLGQRAAGVAPALQTGISSIIPVLYHAFYMPFMYVLQKLEDISPLFCLLPIVIAPAIYHVAYTLGMKGFSIGAKLVYKKQDTK